MPRKLKAKNNLKAEKLSAQVEDGYLCRICCKSFEELKELYSHRYNDHRDELHFRCNACEWAGRCRKDLEDHVRTHTKERPFSCSVCKKSFTQAGNRMRHMRIHKLDKLKQKGDRNCDEKIAVLMYKCPSCDKTFTQKGHMQRHNLTHTGAKPHRCDDCDATFSLKHQLVRHIRRHTGEKPYKCDFCSKTFRNDCVYKSHLRTHTGEKPYQCKMCSVGFAQHTQLKAHKVNFHGAKLHSCGICDKDFASVGSLFYHFYQHPESGPSPSCDKCGQRFYSRRACRIHICGDVRSSRAHKHLVHLEKLKSKSCHFDRVQDVEKRESDTEIDEKDKIPTTSFRSR